MRCLLLAYIQARAATVDLDEVGEEDEAIAFEKSEREKVQTAALEAFSHNGNNDDSVYVENLKVIRVSYVYHLFNGHGECVSLNYSIS